jgi:hypothetical protein
MLLERKAMKKRGGTWRERGGEMEMEMEMEVEIEVEVERVDGRRGRKEGKKIQEKK